MDSLLSLLEKAGREVQVQIEPQLSGIFGGVVRAYLPQTWVFRTERETVSLAVDAAGVVTVTRGAAPHPDVTVETSFERLSAALRTRSRKEVPRGPLQVTPHTSKGKTAFEFLRGRFGL